MQLCQPELAKIVNEYHDRGFAVVENFLAREEIEKIRGKALELLRAKSRELNPDGKLLPGQALDEPHKSEFYAAVADGKTRLFYEPRAVDKENQQLRVAPEEGACMLGFALHHDDPLFMQLARSPAVADILRALNYTDPTLILTLVALNNPQPKGAPFPHQDAQILTTTAPEHVVGFCLSLDEAADESGGLEVIPGSHKWPLARKLERVAGGRRPDGTILEWSAPMPSYDQQMFVRVPAKLGDLVIMSGLQVHQRQPNRGAKARWSLMFHVFDAAKCRYVDGQLPSNCPAFEPLFVK